MGKLIALLSAGSGTVVVSVGGFYLVKNGLAEENGGSEQSQTAPATNKKLKFGDLKEFQDAKGGNCAKSLFGESGIDFSSVSETPTTLSDGDSFFGNVPTQETSPNTKGCLIINWEKKTGSEDKGNGTFTGTWAFVNGNKGFINFNVAKTNETSHQLDLTGGFYLLEKNGSDKGTIKWWKEVKDTDSNKKKVDKTDFAEKFPKAKSGSVVQIENKDYWGFVDEVDKLEKISDTLTGEKTKVENKKGTGTWKKGGSNGVGNWSNDLKWWKHVYESNDFDLTTKLGSFVGTGSLDSSASE